MKEAVTLEQEMGFRLGLLTTQRRLSPQCRLVRSMTTDIVASRHAAKQITSALGKPGGEIK